MANETSLILEKASALLKTKERVIIAIDGRCASGKTTLAERLQRSSDCAVIHMDDFFLRPEQRTEQRYNKPGGNIDHERFSEEVIKPLLKNSAFTYKPYDCKTRGFSRPVSVTPNKITVVEGSYSCHPVLWDNYDLRIFLTVEKHEQLRRVGLRNGQASLAVFCEKWIPLEERYFKTFDIENRCDLLIETYCSAN